MSNIKNIKVMETGISHYVVNGCKIVNMPTFRDKLKEAYWYSRLTDKVEAGASDAKFFYQRHFDTIRESRRSFTRDFKAHYCVVRVSLTGRVKNYEALRNVPRDLRLVEGCVINTHGLICQDLRFNPHFEFLKWGGRWCGFHWDSADYRVSQEYALLFIEHFRKMGMDAAVVSKTLN